MSDKKAVIGLYRSLLRESLKFSNFSYRKYAYNRTRDYFRELKDVKDKEQLEKAMKFGKDNLEVLKRQVLINSLYSTDKLVIENSKK